MSVSWETMSRVLAWRTEQQTRRYRKQKVGVHTDFNGDKIPDGKAQKK